MVDTPNCSVDSTHVSPFDMTWVFLIFHVEKEDGDLDKLIFALMA